VGEATMRTDRELVEEARKSNPAVFSELVRRYERIALSTAWNVLRDYHLAQDAVQNAFVEAFKRLGQLRTPDHFGAWIVVITRRQAVRQAVHAREMIALEFANEARAEAPGADSDPMGELMAAVGQLPRQERIVVGLRYLDGHTVREVATLTGRPIGTVTKQLSRAVHRLKLALNRSDVPHGTTKH
jgi:RNA polymerase sigma-70 factor (ECF subfamily)